MQNANEALDWLVAACQESIPQGDSESYELLAKAHGLIQESMASAREEELAAGIKSMLSLLEMGATYYGELYESLSVRIRIISNRDDKMATAVAIAETAGAAAGLGSLLAHLISDDSKTFHRIEEIFTGKGLTYPRVLNRSKEIVRFDGNTSNM